MDLLSKIRSHISEKNELADYKSDLINKSFAFFRKIRLKILNTKIKKLEKIIFNETDQYLLSSDETYQKIALDNYQLLKNPKIVFKVYETSYASNGKYTEKLKGKIHPNGVGYLYESDSSIATRNYVDSEFPSKIAGKIDHFGIINLKTVETNRKLFKKLADEFIGSVDENGYMELKVNESKNVVEVFSKGVICIGKLIGDHFNGNLQKINAFNDNVAKMIGMIEDFKSGIR